MKTKTLVLTAIISLGMVFQGCEKESNPTPNGLDTVNSFEKKTTKKSINKSYPIQIVVDENDPSFLDDAIGLLDEGEIIEATYNTYGEAEYQIIPNPNPNDEPNNPSDPARQITCAQSDPNCRYQVRLRWQYNVNRGICFDFGTDPYNDMIWICDEPC